MEEFFTKIVIHLLRYVVMPLRELILDKFIKSRFISYHKEILVPYMEKHGKDALYSGDTEYIDNKFLNDLEKIIEDKIYKKDEDKEGEDKRYKKDNEIDYELYNSIPSYVDHLRRTDRKYTLFVFLVVDYWALKPNTTGISLGKRDWPVVIIGIIGIMAILLLLLFNIQIYPISISLLILLLGSYLVYTSLILEQYKFYYNIKVSTKSDTYEEKIKRFKQIIKDLEIDELANVKEIVRASSKEAIKSDVNDTKFVDIFLKSRSSRTTENLENQYYKRLLYPFMHDFGFDYLEHLGDNSWMDNNKESIKDKLDEFKDDNQIMYGVPPYIRKRLQDNSSYNEKDKLNYLIKLLIGDYFRFTPNKEYRENNQHSFISTLTLIGTIITWFILVLVLTIYITNEVISNYDINDWIELFILLGIMGTVTIILKEIVIMPLERFMFKKWREKYWIEDYTFYSDSFSKLEKRSMEGYKKMVEYGRYE